MKLVQTNCLSCRLTQSIPPIGVVETDPLHVKNHIAPRAELRHARVVQLGLWLASIQVTHTGTHPRNRTQTMHQLISGTPLAHLLRASRPSSSGYIEISRTPASKFTVGCEQDCTCSKQVTCNVTAHYERAGNGTLQLVHMQQELL